MKSTKEKIKVMQAYEDGETLQIMLRDESPCWTDAIIKNKEPEFRWGEFDYRIKPQELQTDWSKVAKGTAVLVSDDLTKEWEYATFIKTDNSNDYPFQAINDNESWWKHCKLDKSAPSIINWIKNTGEEPKGNWIARTSFGEIVSRHTGFITNWSLGANTPVVEYAIIE